MFKKIILILLLLFAVLVFFQWDRIRSYFSREARTVNTTEVKLLFREDPNLDTLMSVLIRNEVIDDPETAKKLIIENGIDTNNFAAGKYVVLSGTRLSSLFDGFVKDETGQGKAEVKVNVIFNNCRDIYDVGMNISKCILADSASIVNCILNTETLEKYHFTREQIPALFLPRQYEMYFDTDAEAFVAFMAEEFKKFWTEERKIKMKEIGLSSPSQVVTLASIVYSEQSKVPEEWPLISSLYLNRLRKGMRLQSDPTFKFCWGRELDGVQRLLNKHREINCAYNTYKIDGLPPGPICITPGGVIDAVLNPANADYLFMCAKPDYSGEHNFTASGTQHELNAAVYRKWLAKQLSS